MSALDFPGTEIKTKILTGAPLDFAGTEPQVAPIMSEPPIPEPIVPTLATGEKTIDHRPAALGAAGMLGSVIGSPAGPLGMVAGGSLAVAGMSTYLDALERTLNKWRGFKVQDSGDFLRDTTKKAVDEAGLDAAFSMGFMSLGPITRRIGKYAVGKFMGVTGEEAVKAADEAAAQGINLGAAHVSKSGFVKGFPRVVGVFPFVGKPFKVNQSRVVGEIDAHAADILNTIAPPTTQLKAGEAAVVAAKKRFDKFSNVKSSLYEHFYKLADDLPERDIVKTWGIKIGLNDEILEKELKETIALKSGETMRRFKSDEIGDFIGQIKELPDRLTVEQARGLQRELNQISIKAKLDGYDISRLRQLKDLITAAVHNPDLSRISADEAAKVSSALTEANEFFINGKKIFESVTARKFGAVEKNIFAAGVKRPGTITPDKLFKRAYDASSPMALEDLRKLVGRNQFNGMTRQFLDDAVEASMIKSKAGMTGPRLFNAEKFEKALGLNTPEGWASLQTMLKDTPVTIKDWTMFLKAAKTGSDIVIRDPSSFVARRLVLAGGTMGAAVGAGLVGGAQASIPMALFLTLALKKTGNVMMDPNSLRAMNKVMDDTVPMQIRRAMIGRLFKQEENENEAR